MIVGLDSQVSDVVYINSYLTNGVSHHYQLDESTFNFWCVRSDFYFLSLFSLKLLCANRIAPDGRHIWGYSVCLCPIKRTPGVNELRCFVNVTSLRSVGYLHKMTEVEGIYTTINTDSQMVTYVIAKKTRFLTIFTCILTKEVLHYLIFFLFSTNVKYIFQPMFSIFFK